jgi:quercetin dioxygenase-like cupin family protein
MEATVPRTISRDDGEQVPLGGLDIIFKITSDQTGGALAICETAVEPGRLIPAHLHDTEDEFTYVIDGRIGVLIGEEFHPDLEQPLMDQHNVRVIGT